MSTVLGTLLLLSTLQIIETNSFAPVAGNLILTQSRTNLRYSYSNSVSSDGNPIGTARFDTQRFETPTSTRSSPLLGLILLIFSKKLFPSMRFEPSTAPMTRIFEAFV